MAPWVDIPLATGEGQSLSPYASDAELVNLHLVPLPQGSRTPFAIHGTPAFDSTQVFGLGSGTSACRGAAMFAGKLFFVVGTSVRYTDGGSVTEVDAAGMPGTKMCRFADAGTHLVIVDNTNARAVTTFASTACSRGNFSDVTYQDGITFFTETGTNSVYASDVDDPTTIDALSFTTADALGGECVGIISDHREVVVFLTRHIEFYYNTGGAGFPLQRSQPGVAERGCWEARTGTGSARGTIAKHDNSVFFLGDDFRVYRLSGYQPQRVSNEWVERVILAGTAGGSDGNDCRGSVYTFGGRAFYALQTGRTPYYRLVMDIGNGLWFRHERTSIGGDTPYAVDTVNLNYNGNFEAAAIVSDGPTGYGATSGPVLYALMSSVYTDTGAATPIQRTMTLPSISAGAVRSFMHELILDSEKATAASSISLTWSDNGGTSYTSAHTADGTNPRARWQRLGSFYQRILRFLFSTNSRVTVLGVRARIEGGVS